MNKSTSLNQYSCEVQLNPAEIDRITHALSVYVYLKDKNVNIESETKVNNLINCFDPYKIILIKVKNENKHKFLIYSINLNRPIKMQLHELPNLFISLFMFTSLIWSYKVNSIVN